MDPETEALHNHIHEQHRQALAAAQWKLVQANAQIAGKDRIIADLTELLDTATDPDE